MLDKLPGLRTFITGAGKQCGKTTFMNRAASFVRGKGGQPALLTIGYNGETHDTLSGKEKPAVIVKKNDIIVSTEKFLQKANAEILDVLALKGSLGYLCLARAGRQADMVLVGPDSNEQLSELLQYISEEKLADTVFIDGSINRITQTASLDSSQFVYIARVEKASLNHVCTQLKRMWTLLNLPLSLHKPENENTLEIYGSFTQADLARLSEKTETVIVEDFTKIFLDYSELLSFLRGRKLMVRKQIAFLGFNLLCRGLEQKEFAQALQDEELMQFVTWNLYEMQSKENE